MMVLPKVLHLSDGECSVPVDLHESNIRAYKVTPGIKGTDHPAVAVVRLPNLAKQSRLPFTGSEVSLQLISTGEIRLPVQHRP